MIPEPPDSLDEALPLPAFAKQCPLCGNQYLGYMLTLGLQYCPDCHTWLRYVKDSPKNQP
jgi:hypothetical protein